MKIAYLCEPQLGGTFTFFRRLRPALVHHGVDFRCVTGMSSARLQGTRFEGLEGLDCIGYDAQLSGLSEVEGLKSATQATIQHLRDQSYNLVMTLPAADYVSSNLPAYLPRSIRAVMRVPMMTRGAYAPTQAIAPHLNSIFAVSDRITDDLVKRYAIPPDQVDTIYHGVDPAPFEGALAEKRRSETLHLLYAGRLWDMDKGIFLLPDVMRRLVRKGTKVHLTVAGDGPDAEELKQRFERFGLNGRVTMTGGLSLEHVLEQYRRADVFIFPSRFEGCGFAVLEAMAAGCAPVVSDIRGSLRVIVDNGRAGALARVGSARDFADAVEVWAKHPEKLERAQRAARDRIIASFTLERMAAQYAKRFVDVLEQPDRREAVCDIADYVVPLAFRPTWRTRIPRPVKNFARMCLERVGLSS